MANRWRVVFTLSILVLLAGLPLLSAAQSTPSPDQLVFVQDGDIWVADEGAGNALMLADGEPFDPLYSTPGPTYHMPLVLPGRKTVIFANWFSDELWQVPLDGSRSPTRLSDVEILQPFGLVSFPGEHEIGAVVPGEQGLTFTMIALEDGQVVPLADIPFEGGCGGGPDLPDTQTYDRQVAPLDMVLAGRTLLISMACGGQGIQAIDLDSGQSTVLSPDLHHIRLSPDGTQVAGIAENEIWMIDLATGATASIYGGQSSPDLLVWTPGGDLIFSSIQEQEAIPLTPVDALLADEVLFGLSSESVPVYGVSLYLLDVDVQTTLELWASQNARGIGALAVANDQVYFSLVDSMAGLVRALNDGRNRTEVLAQWPDSNLYRLSLNGGTAEFLVEGGESPVILE